MGAWIAQAAAHGIRLGVPDAQERAERFFITLEGTWLLARVQRSCAPFHLAAAMVA